MLRSLASPFKVRHLKLSLALLTPGLTPLAAHAELAGFNPGFLYPGSAAGAALAALDQGHSLSAGEHTVQVSINAEDVGQHRFDFVAGQDGRLAPCLPVSWLAEHGLRLEALPSSQARQADCLNLPEALPDSTVELDAQAMKLKVSIAQTAMRRTAQGTVPASRWDGGINAAFLNYQASALRGYGAGGNHANEDLLLNSGLNLGPWRLRAGYNLRGDDTGRQWLRNYAYAQRDVPGLHANLTLGETSTAGDVFTSTQIRGVVLASDAAMLPDSLQAYAPSYGVWRRAGPG